MQRKKILYVVTKSVWGGAQKYVWQLATLLPKDEFETVVATGGSGPLIEKLREAKIRTVSIPGLRRDIRVLDEIISFFALIRLCRDEKPNIIHLNSSKAGGLGALAGRIASLIGRRRVSIIFTAHGWAFHEDRPLWSRGLIAFLTWLGALFQNTIVTIDTADNDAVRSFIPHRKLSLIFNGIEPFACMNQSEARHFFSKKIGHELAGTTLIGVNSELTKNKGLPFLLAAARHMKSEHPDMPFHVVIMGDGEDRKKLEQEIKDLGLERTVFLAGFIPDAKRYLSACDVFCMPSIKEGLPYAILEAMSAGLPVVATYVGGIPDLIKNEKTGILVPPKDPPALAKAIHSLLQNPKKRHTFGENAKKDVRERFSLDQMTQKTITIYRHAS